ncbi:50S ribosomal protein L11 methyltransferase [Ostreibacterium oceani]|uniref:Ribosomal protein L11 methyltransferase n=1 Tax=Ostreibacterium oceani TaxID=2654998 RepID=A0A6N7EXX1_9GAMM|nr:50S ribosomal protein L11 methyltransferase [Ostreibacterium oceani]MPV86390.1 50S ribosomal protein L11 methyltransferase [Ostreibacterium oceani]
MSAPANSDWLEIILETTSTLDNETLEEALFAAGALSVTLTSKQDEVILVEPNPGDLPLWESEILVTGLFEHDTTTDATLDLLSRILAPQPVPVVNIHRLADRVWETEWTKHFSPQQFAQHLWVCPSHQSIPASALTDKTQVITLDPGLAFGTGTHPTTAMALTYIASRRFDGQRVIDYGCGSGILGIAAIKMGAAHCIMTDIDDKALDTTATNARINAVSHATSNYLPDTVPNAPVDFIIANILLTPLLTLKDTFVSLCHDNTTILLTGLLSTQAEAIQSHYQTDFCDFAITHQGDWCMLTAQRHTHQSTRRNAQ